MITQAYVDFFSELASNNHRDWFQANKSRYEQEVRKPFIALVEAIIQQLLDFDQEVAIEPKQALFRINRDVRFSKDKTPYNTIMKAGISPGGKRSALPGYYLGIDADKIHVGGGMYGLDPKQLKQVRSYIADNYSQLHEIVESDEFIKAFKSLKGERAKRLDPAFKEILEQTPYIANKQFYAMEEMSLKDHLNSTELASALTNRFRAIHGLNVFLRQALA